MGEEGGRRGGRAGRRAGGEEGEQGAGEVLGQVGRQVQVQVQVQVQGAGCRQVQVDGQMAETISELTQWLSRKTCSNLKLMQCCRRTFLKRGI